MTDPLQQPLRGIAIYNPDLLSKEELIDLFVVRQPLLNRLLTDLRNPGAGGGPHHLVVGQRGMGKTTLLRRLGYAVVDDPRLSRLWLPLTFPEEQYNVVRLSDLYLNWIDALGDALEQGGDTRDTRELDIAVKRLPQGDEGHRAREALNLLLTQAGKTGKRLLLLIDNLDLILNRLKDDQWAIRELLSQEKGPLLVGASSRITEDVYHYGRAFYDYFQIDEIKGLTELETRNLLLHLSRRSETPEVERLLDNDPARIRALHVLTGGNPRTVVLLYNVLALGVDGDVRTDLQRLLDHSTPLYKARFEGLPTQAQQIMDALAIHWDPISAGELAQIVRLETNTVSSQLNRLVNDGLVEKVAYYPGTKTGFQIAERFFNIWYLMRASRRVRTKLVWLVEFLRCLYAQEEWTVMSVLSTKIPDTSFQADGGSRAAAETILSKAIELDTATLHQRSWTSLMPLFAQTAATGHAALAVELLDQRGRRDQWRPLREALATVAAGTRDYLRRVAPEIRQPAEQILALLTPVETPAPARR